MKKFLIGLGLGLGTGVIVTRNWGIIKTRLHDLTANDVHTQHEVKNRATATPAAETVSE